MHAKWGVVSALAVLAATAVSCGGDDVVGPKKEEITGVWHATKVEYASTGSLGTVDLCTLGATATMVINADNTLQYTLTPSTGAPTVLNATWEMTTDLMKVTPAGATWYWAWDASLTAGSLKLTGADSGYDFNADGTNEPAKWSLTLAR